MSKKVFEVPLIAISTSVLEVEADSLKDACMSVTEYAEEDGWDMLCEVIYDFPTADIDWEELVKNTQLEKEPWLLEMHNDVQKALSEM